MSSSDTPATTSKLADKPFIAGTRTHSVRGSYPNRVAIAENISSMKEYSEDGKYYWYGTELLEFTEQPDGFWKERLISRGKGYPSTNFI